MASVNALARELVLKIVYYGPGLSGKTTTLQHIHATAKPEHRGKLVSLATPVDRTLYFDFLPIRLPCVHGMGIRLQLFTVPGQVYFNATRRLVLTGADGLVFVTDSQAERMDANLETLQNLQDNLRELRRELSRVPHVVQHNKRDLDGVLPVDELDRLLNPHDVPSFATTATHGHGVYEALEGITKLVLRDVDAMLPASTQQPAAQLVAVEGGLAAALREAEAPEASAPSTPVATETVMSPPSTVVMEVGGANAGEHAARALTMDATAAFSLSELWAEADRPIVRQIETAIAIGRYTQAVELCDTLLARVLASAAGLFGNADAPRDAATVPLLLGLDGRRYLGFREIVRRARSGGVVDASQVLKAYVFAAEARVQRSAL